jgi:ribosomal protein S18 acetylase RimI-like enzyme
VSKFSIRNFKHGFFSSDLVEVVNLYNLTMIGVHGFHPVTLKEFGERVIKCRHFKPELFLIAQLGDEIIGMCHAVTARESGSPEGGAIEMVAVHPRHQGRGVGTSLVRDAAKALRKENIYTIDGGGTFPFSPCYSTLLDGSERSGPELTNRSFIKILEKCGFKKGRTSLVMRADLSQELPELDGRFAEMFETSHYAVSAREGKDTWLDYVFRGWDLFDSSLSGAADNELSSRAIFGLMPELSRFEKKNIYAVFGVNTPEKKRGQGWATLHFRELRKYLKSLGADVLELHVYEDNEPAVKLYRTSGFEEIGNTVAMSMQF